MAGARRIASKATCRQAIAQIAFLLILLTFSSEGVTISTTQIGNYLVIFKTDKGLHPFSVYIRGIMKISAKGEYALRAVNYLAFHYGEGFIQLKVIALEEGIPVKFLEQILLALKRAGYLKSRSGPGGGYYLSRHPSEVTVAQIMESMDVSASPLDCLDGCEEYECSKQDEGSACDLRWLWRDIRKQTVRILENTTFQDIRDRKARAAYNRGL